MKSSLRFHQISEFERKQFQEKLQGELNSLNEIQQVLEDSLSQSTDNREFYKQRAKAIKLETDLKTKIKQLQVDQHLQMLTLTFPEMKELEKELKKRIVKQLDSQQIQETLSFLQSRLEDEILQEEFGLKSGFKKFPITSQEVDLLLNNKAG